MDPVRLVRWADLAAKVALVVLLVTAILFPDLSGLKEKAGTARLIVYPLGAVVVPLWWWAYGRRRSVTRRFPWMGDLLFTLPWLLDLLGNRLNLFDTVPWWDDLLHLVNWALLTAGALLAWRPSTAVSAGLVVMVALGFGTGAAVLWELGEYVAFIRASPELLSAYTDTLGDLALGSLGALLAGLVVGLKGRTRPEVDAAPSAKRSVG